jgi:hypothetical protein
MKHGDIFNPKYAYCAYHNVVYSSSSMIRMYIFFVSDPIEYKNCITINIYPTQCISRVQDHILKPNMNQFSGISHVMYQFDENILYTMQYEELWELSEDETMDVLSEVI